MRARLIVHRLQTKLQGIGGLSELQDLGDTK
jgi:hypothetical protein